jgi:hypothetical protein
MPIAENLSKAGIAIVMVAASAANAAEVDRSARHAEELSHQYGDYRNPGNLHGGETVRINTPEGPITCTGGTGREYTGKRGPAGAVVHEETNRKCHFD